MLDDCGRPIGGDVVAGQEDPPRGWFSRYYGEKVAVPSLAVEATRVLPTTFVSVLSGGRPQIHVDGERWSIRLAERRVEFRLAAGLISDVTGGTACTS